MPVNMSDNNTVWVIKWDFSYLKIYVVFTYALVVKALLKALNEHQKVQTQKRSVRSFRVLAAGPPEDENACPGQYRVMCNQQFGIPNGS
jgi:hypothetical protein